MSHTEVEELTQAYLEWVQTTDSLLEQALNQLYREPNLSWVQEVRHRIGRDMCDIDIRRLTTQAWLRCGEEAVRSARQLFSEFTLNGSERVEGGPWLALKKSHDILMDSCLLQYQYLSAQDRGRVNSMLDLLLLGGEPIGMWTMVPASGDRKSGGRMPRI